MAHITLTGVLLDPTGEFSVGDRVRFTHRTSTGDTVKTAQSVLTIPPDGSYSIDLEYGEILVEYSDYRKPRFKNVGVVIVNEDSTATSIPELLNAVVPPTDAQLLQFQAILGDAVSAKDDAEQARDEAEEARDETTDFKDSLLAMTKADFFALAEKRIRDNAGSGFAEWGSTYSSSQHEPINEGMYDSSVVSDTLTMSRGSDYNPIGASRTITPIVNVSGVSHTLDYINTSSEANKNAIKFPPAPDGTKTYDSATGAVVQHASPAEAFRGVIRNGTFDSTDGYSQDDITLTISNGIGQVIGQSSGNFGVQTKASTFLTNGVAYAIEVRARVTSGSTNLFIGLSDTPTSLGGHPSHMVNLTDEFQLLNFEITADDTNLDHVLFTTNNPSFTYEFSYISVTPVTEQVITSRQDYVFLESWHEKIEDKGQVYPLGNVQYGASSYEDISLSTRDDGYTRFGEWDTDTTGRYATWDSLTDAQKTKFLSNPENNIYLDGDDLIQVRYRVRVVEGLGDDWAYVQPFDVITNSTHWLSYSGTDALISQRGNSTDNIDWFKDLQDANRLFGGISRPEYTESDWGVFEPTSGDSPVALDNKIFALPIALVQRRNQGAYHPSFNPEGCAAFTASNGDTVSRSWEHANVIGSGKVTSALSCFNFGNIKGDAASFTGFIGSVTANAQAGRTDDKFYDAIYASDVQDLRMSSRRRPLAEIREEAKRKAIAGEVRGFEGVPRSVMFANTTVKNSNDSVITIEPSDILGESLPPASGQFATGYNGYAILNSNEVHPIIRIQRYSTNDTEYEFKLGGSYSGTSSSATVQLVVDRPSEHSQANPTWTDIIGDPANIAATFPNGVEGQWIPEEMTGTAGTWSFNRKVMNTPVKRLDSFDDGASWSSSDRIIDLTNNNAAGQVGFLGMVRLYHYETQAHFTEDDVNSEVFDLGDVFSVNNNQAYNGAMLVASLLDKVAVNDTGLREQGFALDEVSLRYTDGSLTPLTRLNGDSVRGYNSHTSISLEGISPAVKTLDYLSSDNGVGKLCYAYKEMIYDTSWGDDNKFQIADNQESFTDDNGNTGLRGTASFNTQYFIDGSN